ncbi:MAG: hypothetical protein J6S63_01060 [Atopobiaceae bacterium]|nr:hypothetical protein [Atopobiaceae bacterium]
MTNTEAIDTRISCRAYTDEPLDEGTLDKLRTYVDELVAESGLRFVLVGPSDGGATLKLSGRMFSGNVSTYLALIGPDDNDTRERFGYYGEKFVLYATTLGLGTCWVAGTFDRASVVVPLADDEVIHDVIPVGNAPAKQPFAQRTIRAGLRRRDKKPETLYQGHTSLAHAPAWIRAGIQSVIKGPSAVNQQPVVFMHDARGLRATLPNAKREVAYTDLGIAKLHFELGAATEGMHGSWQWGTKGVFA